MLLEGNAYVLVKKLKCYTFSLTLEVCSQCICVICQETDKIKYVKYLNIQCTENIYYAKKYINK